MKRLMIIFAVMATMLASCSKSEPESGASANGVIQLNLSVSNPCSDSKVLIKTGWTTDDRIEIWYDGNTQSTPDLVIRYNGSKWIEDGDAATSGNDPSEGDGKYVKAVYNGSLVVASKDGYTFKNNTLSTRIEHWTFLTEIQVVVSGLDSAEYGKYTLSCNNFTPFKGITVGADAITANAGTASTPVSGISNTDGVAFVFASCTKYGTSAEYKFSLSDGTSGSTFTSSTPTNPEFVDLGLPSGLKWAVHNVGASSPEEYGYYFFWGGTQGYVHVSVKESPEYIKTINKDITRIKAIKIPNSFTNRNCWVKAENGEELVNGFCWKNTPFNNESSSYDETYFSGVRSTVCPGDVLAKAFDAANKYCGAGYRMPTSAEFQELIDNTINEFVTDYNGKSVNGILFTSRKDSNMSVFFPATGCGGDNSLLSPGFLACYWSCSLFSGNPKESYYLNEFLDSPCCLLDGGRFNGTSIRPVSD